MSVSRICRRFAGICQLRLALPSLNQVGASAYPVRVP